MSLWTKCVVSLALSVCATALGASPSLGQGVSDQAIRDRLLQDPAYRAWLMKNRAPAYQAELLRRWQRVASFPDSDFISSSSPKKPIVAVLACSTYCTPPLMLLDTGADSTMIAPQLLHVMDSSIVGQTTILGATGDEARVDVYAITSLAVGHASVGPMRVLSYRAAVLSAAPGKYDGILGRDFLDHFQVNIDSVAGRVTLIPKR